MGEWMDVQEMDECLGFQEVSVQVDGLVYKVTDSNPHGKHVHTHNMLQQHTMLQIVQVIV
jgi:hypothetical protein